MAEWKSTLSLVPTVAVTAADKVSTILKSFRTVLNIILTILQTAKTFLVDLGNPLKVILETIVNFIIDMLADLDQAIGIYILPIGPLVQGQQISELRGGITNFNQKFVDSLYDSADSRRPQFSSATMAWAFAIVIDSGSLGSIIEEFLRLLISMGESITYNLPAPENVRSFPIAEDGTPLTSSLLAMRFDAEGVVLEWSLGVSNKGAGLADAFVPPKWRIERSRTKTGDQLFVYEEAYNAAGEKVMFERPVVDAFGRPVYIWEHVKDIDASDVRFWLGEASGIYKYKDLTVNPGETWYYRIRSMVGEVPTTITSDYIFDGVLRTGGFLGTPCSPIEVFLTQKADGIGSGNPVAALSDTLYAAMILGFHVPTSGSPAFTGHGVLYKQYPWIWDLLEYPLETQDFYLTRLALASKLAEIISMNLVRSKSSFQKFWDAYTTYKSDIDVVVGLAGLSETYTYLDEDLGTMSIEPLRVSVLSVILSITGSMAIRGAPPNWASFRTSNIIPAEVFGMIRKIEAEMRGLLSAYDGIVTDVITFIELLEARINALNDLITYVESILNILSNLTFPSASTLLVSGSGIDGVITEYLAAEGGPEPNEDNYTVGAVLMWAVPGLSLFFDLLQSFSEGGE